MAGMAGTAGKSRWKGPFAPRGPVRAITGALLAVATVVTLFPFYTMVVIALKPTQAVTFPKSLLPWPLTLESFRPVLETEGVARWAFNTLVYSLVSVVLVLFLSSLAGYAFAKMRFPGRNAMFWSVLAMLMVPYHITLIPTFILIARAGGVDSYWGLIAPTLANAQAVFLMRQFIKTIPDELLDAARVDGCSEWRGYLTIILPLCKPILATLGIFVFLWHWNDFLWPLIVSQDISMRTLTVGIASLQQQGTSLNVLFAGTLVSFIPIFAAYLIGQRYLTEGVLSSGIKG
jgi:multiple sugar transport system permease protein